MDGDKLVYEFLVMFQAGHTDGYTHFYSGPLYESRDGAEHASAQTHGSYSVEAKAITCVRFTSGSAAGGTYIVDGPYKTFADAEMEDKIRKSAMAKLTSAEKKVLGL